MAFFCYNLDMVTQFFILGSSSIYGVGGSHAGFADLIKQYLHSKMYDEGGVGEKYEVYNFGKSGATISFVKEALPWLLKNYSRSGKLVFIVSVGGNNSKARNTPDNFISTPEAYRQEMEVLLDLLKQHSDRVIVVGNAFVDESKTSPKSDPLSSNVDYFTNTRRRQFTGINKEICEEYGLDFVDVNVSQQEWVEKYLYEDGLHSNQAGHQLIFETLRPLIDQAIVKS
jgi:lysophospholipase L1-like esterase